MLPCRSHGAYGSLPHRYWRPGYMIETTRSGSGRKSVGQLLERSMTPPGQAGDLAQRKVKRG